MDAEEKEKRVCPRCGGTYNWLNDKQVGSRTYRYAVNKGKGKKTRQCYLGPTRGYVEVTPLHESLGLELKGLVVSDGERFSDYVDAIIGSIDGLELKEDNVRSLAEKFKRLAEHLEEYATTIAFA